MPAIAKQQDWRHAPPGPDEEAKINHVLAESFPASDAPSWTLAVSRSPARSVVDVSRPPSRDGVWKGLVALIEAAALVPAVGLAILAVGIPVVIAARLVIDAVIWIVARL